LDSAAGEGGRENLQLLPGSGRLKPAESQNETLFIAAQPPVVLTKSRRRSVKSNAIYYWQSAAQVDSSKGNALRFRYRQSANLKQMVYSICCSYHLERGERPLGIASQVGVNSISGRYRFDQLKLMCSDLPSIFTNQVGIHPKDYGYAPLLAQERWRYFLLLRGDEVQ
jgi:hypothetical protein